MTDASDAGFRAAITGARTLPIEVRAAVPVPVDPIDALVKRQESSFRRRRFSLRSTAGCVPVLAPSVPVAPVHSVPASARRVRAHLGRQGVAKCCSSAPSSAVATKTTLPR